MGFDERPLQAGGRDAHAPAHRSRSTAALRLRVSPQRHGQRVHDRRAADGLAARRGDRTPHRLGLRAPDALAGGPGVPTGRADPGGAGQPEHPLAGLVVRGVPRPGGTAPGEEARVPPHAQARQWLNVAECELAVLATQCLDRRLPDLASVAREVAAWEVRRNRDRPTVRWHFTTAQARRKLNHLYPHPA